MAPGACESNRRGDDGVIETRVVGDGVPALAPPGLEVRAADLFTHAA